MRINHARRELFIEIAAALFVLLFLYTALSKLQGFTRFARSMLHSPIIARYHIALAVAVPLAELIVVALLIIPRYRAKGLAAATALMAVFTGYVGYVLLTSARLPCTCGGIIEDMSWKQHFIFNSFFLLLGIIATALSRTSYHGKQEKPNT